MQAESEQAPEPAAESGATPKPLPDEALRGPNMQETVHNAAMTLPVNTEFQPTKIENILKAEAPMAVAIYEITEKKVRDTLGRLSKDPARGIERSKPGTRGPHGHPPTFRRGQSAASAGFVPATHELPLRAESSPVALGRFQSLKQDTEP